MIPIIAVENSLRYWQSRYFKMIFLTNRDPAGWMDACIARRRMHAYMHVWNYGRRDGDFRICIEGIGERIPLGLESYN